MSEADEQERAEEPPRRRRRRWLRALAVLALLLLAMVAVAWWQRIQIAQGFLARELARRGVPARYVVKEIGFFRQRVEQLSIGDPARPDLTADWVDIDTGFTLGGPVVTGVRAGPLRMRGRLVDGKLRLGALDRLLPPPSGKPVSLPELHVELADARMDLATPQGAVVLRLAGRGQLNDGFAGRLRAASPALDLGNCTIRRPVADVAIRIADAKPTIRGPLGAGALACGESLVWEPVADLAVTLDESLARWRGQAKLSVASVQAMEMLAEPLRGTVSFEGSAVRTAGTLDVDAGRFAMDGGTGERIKVAGRYRIGGDGMRFEGSVGAGRAALDRDMRETLAGFGRSGAGTPFGPLVAQLARATEAAARGGSLNATLAVEAAGKIGSVRIARARFDAASGAAAELAGEEGLLIRWPGGPTLNGMLTLRGDGMPEAAVRLAQAQPDAPITGTALVMPYAAGGARLDLETVRFTAGAGGLTHIATRATLSGPLGDGRIEKLRLPLDGRWDGGTLRLNPACAPVGFDRLRVSSLELNATRLTLCPVQGAMVTLRGGTFAGGARIGAFRLGGRIGSSPLSLAASSGRYDLARNGFALTDVATRIGSESVTLLDIGRLDGRIANGVVAGDFAGAGGRIGAVPLLLSDAAGKWTFAGGRLDLEGGLRVADTAESPRFNPLAGRDVRLSLVESRIEASGQLQTPVAGIPVSELTLKHDLSNGSGSAILDVPGIRFTENGLQPSNLTPLTYGVVTAVEGAISGQGRIRWDASGVTSDGIFRTNGANLAAAFGPVTGLAGEIRFEDLLGMRTAPGQMASIVSVNPGLPVENGTVRYQILDSQHVKIEGGRWPFAGGALELDPTILDFSQQQERRMTFRLTGVDAAQFLQEMDYSNLNATGTFDGVLPIVFGARGGRIEGGYLKAREGGSIAYIGELSKEDLGTWGNIAFEALRSLEYRNLDLTMNGPLDGEMLTEIRFAGVSQGKGAKSNFLIRRLQKLPFVFNISVRAPFRQLMESVQSYYDPTRLIQRNLPALMEEQQRREKERQAPQPTQPSVIQPRESETVP